MSARARPVEGNLLTTPVKIMLALWGAGTIAVIARFIQGLGATTAMNDGYPWGLWIAFDVVVGTGLASGGYAMALLVFVFNKGRYHPLVRPALVTSFLGYSIAGIAVAFDLGRFWNLWRVPVTPWDWNGTSILLEVALCMFAYTGVLLLEISPAFLERWSTEGAAARAAFARRWLPRLERALPFIVALGLVLPTMHQSSLGSLLLVAETKVHPLWHTALLPLLFLLTSFGMGYAIIFFEAIFSAYAFRRPLETRMLANLGVFVAGLILAFLAVRFGGLFAADRLGLTVRSGVHSFFLWAETLLLLAAAFLFLQQGVKASAAAQLQAALLALGGGTLYRVDTFLTAYNPGQGWVYFPSYFEILVTLGLVATETVVYVYLVRKFPVLAGVSRSEPRPAPAGLKQGVTT
jgi:Ni/Fe-hydrogenase subunit HybB-like protein